MMSIATKRLALIGACASLAGLAGPAISSASASVFVSNTTPVTTKGGGCEHPRFATIQGAVEASAPGASIKVCPGTYAEQLVIDKGVKIGASGAEGSATVTLPATIAHTSGPCATRPEEMTEVVLCTSESVSLSNLSIEAKFPEGTCNDSLYGIFVGGGATLTAKHDEIHGAGASPINGCQGGVGVEVGTAREPEQVGKAKLVEDSVSEYQKNGITAAGVGSNVAVVKSDIHGAGATTQTAQNGVQISFGSGGSVKGSTIEGNECDHPTACGTNAFESAQATGILLFEAAPTVTISKNTFEADDEGVYFAAGGATQPSSAEVKIVNNRFVDDRFEGLVLEQGDAEVNHNTIEGGQIGIDIIQAEYEPFAPSSSATGDTITGMSKAAVEVQSDNAPGDHPGNFTIKHSAISGNAAEVDDESTTFTVTKSHDT
jgi:Right handed beta helix region